MMRRHDDGLRQMRRRRVFIVKPDDESDADRVGCVERESVIFVLDNETKVWWVICNKKAYSYSLLNGVKLFFL